MHKYVQISQTAHFIYMQFVIYVPTKLLKKNGTTILMNLMTPKGPSTVSSTAYMTEILGDFLIYVSVP